MFRFSSGCNFYCQLTANLKFSTRSFCHKVEIVEWTQFVTNAIPLHDFKNQPDAAYIRDVILPVILETNENADSMPISSEQITKKQRFVTTAH